MLFDPIYLLYGAIFIGVLLTVEGIYFVVADYRTGSERNINRRLRMLATEGDGRKVLYKLRRSAAEHGQWYAIGPLGQLDRLVSQAGLGVSTPRVLAAMAGLAVFLLAALSFGTATPGVAAVVVSLVVGILLPILFLIRRKKARLKQFAEQLPEAIDIMVRSIRAGHPLSSSIALVSREMRDPIGTEFGIATDEMTYGLDLRTALDNMGARVPLQDLHYMVVAIHIQHSTGGNLAEILSNLSKVIRDRFRLFKKINALSAEGRLSATVISALPFLVAGALHAISPTYFTQHAHDSLFLTIIGSGLLGLILGIIIMYRMVKFRV